MPRFPVVAVFFYSFWNGNYSKYTPCGHTGEKERYATSTTYEAQLADVCSEERNSELLFKFKISG
jgi:hypothetical protein